LALVLSFPALARAQESTPNSEPQGFLKEPLAIERVVVAADKRQKKDLNNGYYIEFENMIPGAGWISAGPGYRKWFDKDVAVVDASAAISWRGYKMAQARVEMPKLLRSRLAVGSQLRLQDFTQVNYFGQGPESFEENESEYRLKSTNLVGYATFRPMQWLAVGTSIGWLKPSVEERGGFFGQEVPDTVDLFGDDVVFSQPDQPTFIHTEASITADTRDYPGHPTNGGLYRAAAISYSDRDAGTFSFRRYEVEGARFIPLSDSRVVIGVHGLLAASDTGDGETVPFYLQPTLGGHNSLRSFADYRFHDRNLLLLNVEGRIAMMTHVDAAVFLDAGNVAPRVGDLNLDKRSYGVGLRLHTRRATFARLDLANGSEGWRILFRLSDPLSLSRLVRRTAAVPFVH
jgi:hypothetical protein